MRILPPPNQPSRCSYSLDSVMSLCLLPWLSKPVNSSAWTLMSQLLVSQLPFGPALHYQASPRSHNVISVVWELILDCMVALRHLKGLVKPIKVAWWSTHRLTHFGLETHWKFVLFACWSGHWVTGYNVIIFLLKSARLGTSKMKDPIPEPVPPATEWHNTNPSRLSLLSASLSIISRISSCLASSKQTW